jgi:hypothetical protein
LLLFLFGDRTEQYKGKPFCLLAVQILVEMRSFFAAEPSIADQLHWFRYLAEKKILWYYHFKQLEIILSFME